MSAAPDPSPKSPTSHLHAMNLVVALLAGVISITGGIYSLKNNLFSGPACGSLQGIVRDERIAKPLKLASVEISDLAGAVVNTATTDDEGHYLIEALRTGNYVVKFTAPLHKIESKTIKIEKDLKSSINVDLFPEAQPVQTVFPESPAARTVTPPYIPATTYQTPPAYQTATPAVSSASTVPSTYTPADTPPDFPSNPPRSGFRRYPRHSYPGEPVESTSTASQSPSQGSALAQAGTQLLQAWLSKKSESSTSTSSSGSGQ